MPKTPSRPDTRNPATTGCETAKLAGTFRRTPRYYVSARALAPDPDRALT